MELGLTWFDFFALVILGLSGVMAFARGLIREVFSVIAFIAAGIAAVVFSGVVAPYLVSFTPLSAALSPLAAGLLIFLVVFIAITLVTSTLAKSAHQSTEIGSFDRAAGLAFGVLRGVLVVALAVLLLRQSPEGPVTPPSNLDQCRAAYDELRRPIFCARTFAIYGATASVLDAILPKLAQEILDGPKGESAPIPPPEPAPAPTPAAGPS